MRAKPTQLSAVVVAALAVFAVAAVMLLAGGGSAQATTATVSPNDDGGAPQQTDPTPRHATPEPCPEEDGNTIAQEGVVSTGHIALFDVYWNDDEGELTNNPCPPTVEHVPAQTPVPPGPGNPSGKPGTPARDNRSASNINIEQTIIHVQNDAKINLNAADTPYPQDDYQQLWDADDLEDPNGGDRMVWFLPACPPDSTPETDGLCLSFSAALLNPADWAAGTTVDFLVDHVHQIDIDEQDQRYVLTYDVPAAGSTGARRAKWDTADLDVNKTSVAPGEYERPMWFFTSPGTYEFQVHVLGHPNQTEATERPDGLPPVSVESSVTGDVREYILHVGLMADLGVGVEAVPADSADTTLDPDDEVTITVTASNIGPDTGESTKVDVSLPDGLEYSGHTTATTATIECPDPNGGSTPTQETYCPGTGVWAVGDLPNGDTETLTITATVADGTRGQEQTITADIYATVDIRSHDVVELDPFLANNKRMATITPYEVSNTNPNFFIGLSVPENATHDTQVGSQISVNEPDDGDTLHYSLEGEGAENFHVSTVAGGAQLKVARGAMLDLDRTSEVLDLTLNVRDDEDSAGNTSTAVDDTIPVRVFLEQDPYGFNAQANATGPVALANDSTKSKATFTVTAQRLPSRSGGIASKDDLRIRVVEKAAGAASGEEIDLSDRNWSQTTTQQNEGEATLTWDITKDVDAGSYEYTVDVWVVEGSPEATLATAAASVFTVTW